MLHQLFKLCLFLPVRYFDQSGLTLQEKRNSEQETDDKRQVKCRGCGKIVTSQQHAIEVNNAHQHRYMNPAGIYFSIVLYASANLELHGTPSEEHSWFAGYGWTIALCPDCQQHLGWQFNGRDSHIFYALIRERIVLEN